MQTSLQTVLYSDATKNMGMHIFAVVALLSGPSSLKLPELRIVSLDLIDS